MENSLTFGQRAARKSRVLRRRFRARKRESGRESRSVYFFTFHKCASTLFSSFVLPSARNLEFVDYERMVYDGTIPESQPELIKFDRDGRLYGPIRLSSGAATPTARRMLITAEKEFIHDKIAVSLIRDPRDILVSRYFSFVHSHGESKVPEIARRQQENKDRLIEMGVDEYAVQAVEGVRQDFEMIARIDEYAVDSTVLRYEDLLDDFDLFMDGMSRYLILDEPTIEAIYRRSRPRDTEDINAHRRSGRAGTFAEKLRVETTQLINDKLAGVLDRFGYTNQRSDGHT